MSIPWTPSERATMAGRALTGLLANPTLTTSTTIAESWSDTAVRIANGVFNSLDGTVVASNQTAVIPSVPPTTIIPVDPVA